VYALPYFVSFLLDFDYFKLAFTARNVKKYRKSPLKEQFAAAAANVRAELNNPNYTMIGENIEVLRTAFTASKNAGKTWQIWAATTSTIWIQIQVLFFILYASISFALYNDCHSPMLVHSFFVYQLSAIQ
jgi:hypothetical protein